MLANLEGRWRMSQSWLHSVFSVNDLTVESLISLEQTDILTHTHT